ncbi:DinB superfamily protein [Desulfosporosinus acididurans]|uniref:DinB superfamily protein n=1 Tax=Desulfosporosinus acididurans TaxID=476652 RepID=A0A0J1FJW9_9FIRM|nr:DinB family protein [Desulfosporosinus acididurans]KLU63740.1 DinB superfamily protein [Desulfosporosinus acididurans]
MDKIIKRLNYLIEVLPSRINQFSKEEITVKPNSTWSKKEILGHLCDSATNNHHRFIKIQFEDQPFVVVPYKQNDWVSIQDYQNIPFDEVIGLWTAINKQIVRVISNIPEEKLSYTCDIGNNKCFTFLELIQDYLRHLDHHLIQIFGTSEI